MVAKYTAFSHNTYEKLTRWLTSQYNVTFNLLANIIFIANRIIHNAMFQLRYIYGNRRISIARRRIGQHVFQAIPPLTAHRKIQK